MSPKNKPSDKVHLERFGSIRRDQDRMVYVPNTLRLTHAPSYARMRRTHARTHKTHNTPNPPSSSSSSSLAPPPFFSSELNSRGRQEQPRADRDPHLDRAAWRVMTTACRLHVATRGWNVAQSTDPSTVHLDNSPAAWGPPASFYGDENGGKKDDKGARPVTPVLKILKSAPMSPDGYIKGYRMTSMAVMRNEAQLAQYKASLDDPEADFREKEWAAWMQRFEHERVRGEYTRMQTEKVVRCMVLSTKRNVSKVAVSRNRARVRVTRVLAALLRQHGRPGFDVLALPFAPASFMSERAMWMELATELIHIGAVDADALDGYAVNARLVGKQQAGEAVCAGGVDSLSDVTERVMRLSTKAQRTQTPQRYAWSLFTAATLSKASPGSHLVVGGELRTLVLEHVLRSGRVMASLVDKGLLRERLLTHRLSRVAMLQGLMPVERPLRRMLRCLAESSDAEHLLQVFNEYEALCSLYEKKSRSKHKHKHANG
jgi:RNase P protein component